MHRNHKFATFILALLLTALITPFSASADTISASMYVHFDSSDGGQYTHYDMDGRWGRDYGETFYAYEFEVELTAEELGLYDYETYGYCVDVAQSVSSGSTYSVELTYLSDFNDDTYYEIAWLLDTFAGDSGVSSTAEAMALQSLVWANLSGNTHYMANSWELAGLYNQYATALANLTLTDEIRSNLESTYMVSASPTAQDFMVRIPGGGDKVPEPATVVLLGTGLLGLGILRYRKRG